MLLAILLVGLSLRIYQLDAESLWLDEAYTVDYMAYAGNSLLEVLRMSLPDQNPPLYYVLLHYWMWLFGDSEVSVRLPSVLFGILSVGLIYKVGYTLFDKQTGLIASLILALSAYQVHYAQEARTYSMTVFWGLTSFYLFLRFFEGRDYRVLAGYVLSNAALMYSHYYGLFLVAAQALFVLGYYVFRRREDEAPALRTWAWAAGAMTVLYIPGFFYLAYSLSHSENSNWIETPGLSTLYSSFLEYAGAPNLGSSELLAVLILFALVGVGVLAKKGGERAALSLLSLWLIVPIALPFVLSQVLDPLYHPRYAIAALPALYLLVAVGMQRVGSVAMRATANRLGRLAAVAVTGVLFSLVGFLFFGALHDYFTTVKKQPWREVASYMNMYSRSSDNLVISDAYSTTSYDYYARENDLPEATNVLDPGDAPYVESWVRGSERVWLLLSYVPAEQENQFKEALKKAGFEVADHKIYNEGVAGPKMDLTLYQSGEG